MNVTLAWPKPEINKSVSVTTDPALNVKKQLNQTLRSEIWLTFLKTGRIV
jgi:hypothetical protein